MKFSILIIEFNLPGCSSLKEKRQRMASLRSTYGKQPHIALCESNYQDNHKKAQWSFIITALTSKIIDSTISLIENNIESEVDAQIVNIDRENY